MLTRHEMLKKVMEIQAAKFENSNLYETENGL